MSLKTRVLPFLAALSFASATAQTLPILEQTPARLRWYRIRTPHFSVLYPEGFEKPAQRTAHRLEGIYEPVSATLDKRPRRLPLLLQNQTTVSNGFVTLTPRRSEFFTTPPQDPFLLGTYDWLDLLTVHEYRHVVQFEKALQGFGKAAYYLFGNNALALATLGVPDWFSEGDAVGVETALSGSGRGRIPNFDMGFRANLLAGRRFSYNKAVAGSFRDNVPDHYVLGYLLTTNLRRENGADGWSRVLNEYYHRFPWPFSFSGSVKKVTGSRVDNLYKRTLTDLTETWTKQQEGLKLTPATPLPVRPEKRVFTNYQNPQYVSDSTLLALKTGLGDIAQLVLLRRNGTEKKAFTLGLYNDPDMLSVNAGRAVWVEFRYHPRWGQKVWSELRSLDLTTGRQTRLTSQTRYTAVALSPDGFSIAAVEHTADYKTRLLVLDAETGRVKQTLPNPFDYFYLHPRWTDDSKAIIAVALRDGRKTIQRIDPVTGQRTDLLPELNRNISHPQPWGPYVLYNSPQSGIDNIYAVDTRNGRTYQVTSRPLGAYHAAISPDGKHLAFHDFSADGHRVQEMPLAPERWTPATEVNDRTVRYFGPLVAQEPGVGQARVALSDSAPLPAPFPASRFRRLPHALNIYGWGPIFSSTGQELTLGIDSRDLLATTQLSTGFLYNQAERTGAFFANASYQGLFPVFDLSFQTGRNQTSVYVDRRLPLDSLRSDTWNYNQFSAGIRLPFQLTQTKYRQSLTLSAQYNLIQVSGYDLPARPLNEVGGGRVLNALNYGLTYQRLLKQNKRDVAPPWGQALSLTWRTTPFGGALRAEQISAQGNLFFPGLIKHHSLRLRGGYQQQFQDTYRFSPATFYPRGQLYTSFDKLWVGGAEYRFPVADTHWNIGRLAYIQRIKAAGFYDAAQGDVQVAVVNQNGQLLRFENRRRNLATVGADLSFVFNVLRFRLPFEVGARATYALNTGEFQIEPLVLDIGF
ncbi:hypothetical protein [Rudanella lutea]|uniref:hypothetical protein n=1 Tax=Rudanella lutea TaxID=451374 RepID=UPI00037A9C9C|nr:hypothetical protein [Rudanella lutea]